MASPTYQELVVKGRALYDQMLRAAQEGKHTYRPVPEISPKYNTTLDDPDMASIPTTLQISLANAGHPTDGYIFTQVINPNHKAQSPYQNSIHINGKAILCQNNFANRDVYYRQEGQIFWSDLMAVCCRRVMTVHGGDMKDLEAIWRVTIVNPITKSVIARICGNSYEPVRVEDEDPNFFALLTTDHGKGVARMLATYPEMFGGRIIKSACCYPRGGNRPDLCWLLDVAPEPETKVQTAAPPSPLSRKDVRKHRKAASRSSTNFREVQ